MIHSTWIQYNLPVRPAAPFNPGAPFAPACAIGKGSIGGARDTSWSCSTIQTRGCSDLESSKMKRRWQTINLQLYTTINNQYTPYVISSRSGIISSFMIVNQQKTK